MSRVLFAKGHLSEVLGVELSDRRRVVVKIRPAAQRVAGCVAVQQHVHRMRFPCPEPLTDARPYADGVATAEELVSGGAHLPHSVQAAQLSARLLAALVRIAPSPASIPSLDPTPPWVGWNHVELGTWPRPDDSDIDLNQVAGPPLVEEIGRRVRQRLQADHAPLVVGHLDWESHKILWVGQHPVAVCDWDSAATLPEGAIAGAAAAVFPSSSDGRVVAATLSETACFLEAYLSARGAPWTGDEAEIAWAAGLWVLAYNAKKEAHGGGRGYLGHLEAEGRSRQSLAGA